MKNFLIFCFLILGSFSAFSQTDKEDIRQIFADYSVHVVNKDNAKVVEFMHPGIFEMAPKEMLIELLDKTYADPLIKVELGDMKLDSISDNMIFDGNNKYAEIFHSFKMQMQILPENETPEAMEEAREGGDFTNGMFQEMYGEDNVTFDRESVTFDILINSRTLAIKDQKTIDWKFMELKENTMPMLKNILPQKVLKQLK